MHHDLLAALGAARGLVLVTGPTGQGKTTAIEAVLADRCCPANVVFSGDVRDAGAAVRVVSLARARMVLAVLRISRAADAFGRLSDMGIRAQDLADVAHVFFTTRLLRPGDGVGGAPILVHERLVVTPAIHGLILGGADADSIHRRAIADGMRSLRQWGLDLTHTGQLRRDAMLDATPED